MTPELSKIENRANEILRELSIIEPLVQINEVSKYLNLDVISQDFGPDVSGALIFEGDTAHIGVNSKESLVRKRFTIAHEIGHYLFHEGSARFFVDEKKYQVLFRSGKHSKNFIQEKEANHFAACILMPAHMIEKSFESMQNEMNSLTEEAVIKILSKKYEVSQTAMTYRLTNLGYFWM